MTYEKLEELLKEAGRSYDMELIGHAYEVASAAHRGVKRRSGEPYITHPLSVAALLIDLGLDSASIAAALLHDVVEDTEVTKADVKNAFGEEVANLVDGVTKLGQITFSTMEEQQAENLRKMLLAMSQDIRVMLIKLCDRLHNMRTMAAMPDQKRRDKALETMEVYAPIAHRLGMNNIQEELEDRSLAFLDPVGYQDIVSLLERHGGRGEFIADVARQIRQRLEENGIEKAQLSSRVKSIYGIYRKMYIQNKEFEGIYDVYALRIIVETVAECYNALGVIHDMYHPLPNRFKDYISTPKPNGYQSLHTTVLGHEGIPFEVQIRTWDMHHTAEYGVAAHWKYKAGIQGPDKLEERLAWVRQLLESQRDSEDAVDLLRNIKSELLPEEVFVFTPKGDVINLPTGATVIDFAYAIHTAVGNRMTGAKVNGRIVPIDHKVATGEVIEVLTGAKDKGPSRDWLSIVTTSEAKSKIRNWFKKERREENVAEGKNMLDKELRRNLITLPEDKYDSFMEDIAHRQRMNSAEEMFAALGYGGLQMSRLLPKVKDEYAKLVRSADPVEIFEMPIKKQKSSEGVIVEGIDNCLIKFAKCCNPLPGDEIVGFITRGYGVSIHKKDCPNALVGRNLDESSPRWVNAYWADGVRESFKSTLEIIAVDRPSLIADVSAMIANMKVPIYAFTARQNADGRSSILVTIGINNIDHLGSVIAKLKKVRDVVSVTRT
ncbi:bifunctional (p)ppGpp synthetase/guanosine-3',5'-bis(diphosphate) 3'-pyrophosphohydrolase [Anaerofilum sp. BX8]|uniref:GTP diphosphokinase n=1 Tax=Anaerofilum hominis TaxID=2763016 RepID=A0A923IET0_9FIRM|nr:bifunctional (p)ppGpp synthetase/guanosine-3',5'-bis(diphosphate) 3'-pyrophosphohydrolase [Anaerofilum hominis]MBC5582015.1 bifunctional (p)ppGpp synthetase/guanosine-3',5'-bis(diphosphate) 3'-pyrophosphohydrolase [Anaerofilum hominis]